MKEFFLALKTFCVVGWDLVFHRKEWEEEAQAYDEEFSISPEEVEEHYKDLLNKVKKEYL